jgi:DNA-binding response OmpR family regulator
MNTPGAQPPLIVVADDDDDVRELIEFRLSRAGYAVESGADGEEALDLIRRRRPALAVLDIMMPGLDGFEVTRRLRGDPELDDTQVLLLTASVQEGVASAGFEAGANDHMTKPFSPQELVARVQTMLNGD